MSDIQGMDDFQIGDIVRIKSSGMTSANIIRSGAILDGMVGEIIGLDSDPAHSPYALVRTTSIGCYNVYLSQLERLGNV